MEAKALLPLSQEPATCSCTESDQSGPCRAHLCEEKTIQFSTPARSVCETDRLPFGLSDCLYMNLKSSSVHESQACLMYGAKFIFICTDAS